MLGQQKLANLRGKLFHPLKFSAILIIFSAKLSEQKRAQNGLGTQGITYEVFCLTVLAGCPWFLSYKMHLFNNNFQSDIFNFLVHSYNINVIYSFSKTFLLNRFLLVFGASYTCLNKPYMLSRTDWLYIYGTQT